MPSLPWMWLVDTLHTTQGVTCCQRHECLIVRRHGLGFESCQYRRVLCKCVSSLISVLLREMNTLRYCAILEVRWLSRGTVLSRVLEMCMFIWEFLLLHQSTQTSFPVPAEEKHPYSMMLPLPCFKVGMVCSCAVLVLCHT